MTPEEIDHLEKLRKRMTPGVWELWDGCSWRRIGIRGTEKTVICPTTYSSHPDLIADYTDLRGMVAAVNAFDSLLAAARRLVEVQQQRDELLAACERIWNDWRHSQNAVDSSLDGYESLQVVRTAIAKAKGQP